MIYFIDLSFLISVLTLCVIFLSNLVPEEVVYPPDNMMEIVAKDNSLFEEWSTSVQSSRV